MRKRLSPISAKVARILVRTDFLDVKEQRIDLTGVAVGRIRERVGVGSALNGGNGDEERFWACFSLFEGRAVRFPVRVRETSCVEEIR